MAPLCCTFFFSLPVCTHIYSMGYMVISTKSHYITKGGRDSVWDHHKPHRRGCALTKKMTLKRIPFLCQFEGTLFTLCVNINF